MRKDDKERGGVEGQGSIEIYVGDVLENEENVVVVNADANAEAYEKWRRNAGENICRQD